MNSFRYQAIGAGGARGGRRDRSRRPQGRAAIAQPAQCVSVAPGSGVHAAERKPERHRRRRPAGDFFWPPASGARISRRSRAKSARCWRRAFPFRRRWIAWAKKRKIRRSKRWCNKSARPSAKANHFPRRWRNIRDCSAIFTSSMIRVGEEAGVLPKVMNDLADFAGARRRSARRSAGRRCLSGICFLFRVCDRNRFVDGGSAAAVQHVGGNAARVAAADADFAEGQPRAARPLACDSDWRSLAHCRRPVVVCEFGGGRGGAGTNTN